MSDFRKLVSKAVAVVGSQRELARASGLSQSYISWLLLRAESMSAVSAESAIKIERATAGKVTREQLRPDLFGTKAA